MTDEVFIVYASDRFGQEERVLFVYGSETRAKNTVNNLKDMNQDGLTDYYYLTYKVS